MKAIKISLPFLLNILFIMACNNKTDNNSGTGVNDSTLTDPTTNAMDHHPDQRQEIPLPDSSNTVGTDTISGSQATPNTGTQKSYNDAKGNADSLKKQ